MQIKHVEIRNFRGIKQLAWTIPSSIACLVGPCDSTKTTILEAIDYALSPRWNIGFSDVDFHNADTKQDIEITVIVGQLPKKIMDEFAAGLCLRKWDGTCDLSDTTQEPDDQHEVVVAIRLQVKSDLEPDWCVIDIHGNPHRLSGKERESLGVRRLGSNTDQDLTWGRGSALFRATTKGGVSEATAAMVDVCRTVGDPVCTESMQELLTIIQSIEQASYRLGVRTLNDLRAGIDTQSLMGRTSALCLKEDKIPLRLAGLGTRRLVSVALQKQTTDSGAILLIDEIEHGLEPYRIRHLIRLLQQEVKSHLDSNAKTADAGLGTRETASAGQVILTTHSPTAISELDADELYVVRTTDGNVTINAVDKETMQATVRRFSEAFFSRKVLVCEGATEFGFLIAVRDHWAEKETNKYLAYEQKGVCAVDGKGSDQAAATALHLANLGYHVAFFLDSDKETNPSVAELARHGIATIQWSDGNTIEKQATYDLPLASLNEMLRLAMELNGIDVVKARLRKHTPEGRDLTSLDVDSWLADGMSEEEIRSILGKAATDSKDSRGWFKSIHNGEMLGRLVCGIVASIAEDKGLRKTLSALEQWAYAD